jgi:hypothetical protein
MNNHEAVLAVEDQATEFGLKGVTLKPRWRCTPTIWHAILIAATLLFSYSYFYGNREGWNQASRFDLVRALVEEHRFSIDTYNQNTGDKAVWNGHFYSDKAPGLALSAVPVLEVVHAVLRALHTDLSQAKSITTEIYLVTIICVALPCAVMAGCLFMVALKLGACVNGAGFAAVTLGLATPLCCYATLFWGHPLSAACLFFAFTFAVSLREFDSRSRDLLLSISVGLAAGWATVTEFPAAPAAVILALLVIAIAWPSGSERFTRVVTGVAVGALPCIIVLGVYNLLLFGSPFKLGYSISAQQNWPLMKQGFMGVTYPKAYVLREILVGRYRGLLPLAPVLAAAPFGLILLWKQAKARVSTLAVTAIAIYYVLLNASYASWDGGWSYGPRHLSPALPFLSLPLGLLWTRSSRAVRSVLAVLWLYSASITLLGVSTVVMPTDVKSPVRELLWPTFHAGLIDKNLGMLIGLRGLASLIPLFLVWGAAFAAWVWLRLSLAPKASELTMTYRDSLGWRTRKDDLGTSCG